MKVTMLGDEASRKASESTTWSVSKKFWDREISGTITHYHTPEATERWGTKYGELDSREPPFVRNHTGFGLEVDNATPTGFRAWLAFADFGAALDMAEAFIDMVHESIEKAEREASDKAMAEANASMMSMSASPFNVFRRMSETDKKIAENASTQLSNAEWAEVERRSSEGGDPDPSDAMAPAGDVARESAVAAKDAVTAAQNARPADPLVETCPRCGGSGTVRKDHGPARCGWCDGRGQWLKRLPDAMAPIGDIE